ncbi:hypothetical protein [Paenibacillus sp. SN-8-1]|uniref:hypothetical protein n=1 Tax=Paenibacillus sp. SN-8-1 TaxID=3435409 RepID=UPI003D9A9F29
MLISVGTTEEEINNVLGGISDNWTRFGSPLTELLASDTTENCYFLLDGLKMIDIHFE